MPSCLREALHGPFAAMTAAGMLRRCSAHPGLVRTISSKIAVWRPLAHRAHATLRHSTRRTRLRLFINGGPGSRGCPAACFATYALPNSNAISGRSGELERSVGDDTVAAADSPTPPAQTSNGQATLFAELTDASLSRPISGGRLQRLAVAAAARGIRDPRLWAELSAHAIELNRLAGCSYKQSAEDTSPGLGAAGANGAGEKPTAHESADGSQHSSQDPGIGFSRGFRHFEALRFLSAFLSAGFKDIELLLSFDQIFLRQLHAFDCRHLLQLLHICEQHDHRTRVLYNALFRTLAVQAPSLLFQEITDIFCCFAAHRIGSSSSCLSLLRAAAQQVANSCLSDCIRFCGALHALGMARGLPVAAAATAVATAEEAAATVLALIEQRVAFLVEGLPLQLLLDEVQAFPALEFSWRPYEELADKTLMKALGCWEHCGNVQRLAELACADDVEQLADPFATLQFLRTRGSGHRAFLEAMISWCAAAAYKPATRSQKRPTAEELVMLHDACRECGMADDERLQKAILKFISTKGGTAQRKRFVSPLEYQRNRRYFYLPDLRAIQTPAAN